MRRWAVAVVSAGMSAVTLAGCGGDDVTDALTKAGFIERGNEICAATEERIREGGHDAFPGKGRTPTIAEIEAFAKDTVVPEMQKQISELKKLKPPRDDRSRVAEILAAAQSGLDRVKNDPTSIQSRDLNPFERYDELSSDYGLKICGEVSAHTRELMSGTSRPDPH